jgi:hypothetical protein
MGEPTTPAEARRQGLNRARWVATGAAVGTAALLGGVIATVNGAPASSNSHQLVRSDDGIGDDEYVPAQPFQPQTQTQPTQPQTQTVPQFQPRTRSGGS